MKQSVTRIFLVRHGTAEGADGIAVGQVYLPLASAGTDSLRWQTDKGSTHRAFCCPSACDRYASSC